MGTRKHEVRYNIDVQALYEGTNKKFAKYCHSSLFHELSCSAQIMHRKSQMRCTKLPSSNEHVVREYYDCVYTRGYMVKAKSHPSIEEQTSRTRRSIVYETNSEEGIYLQTKSAVNLRRKCLGISSSSSSISQERTYNNLHHMGVHEPSCGRVPVSLNSQGADFGSETSPPISTSWSAV